MKTYQPLLLLILLSYTDCSNILYIIPFSGTSHYISLRPIGLELARRGHNVTVITSNREANPPPNYRQIMIDDKKIWEAVDRRSLFAMASLSAIDFHRYVIWPGSLALTELTLNSTEVKEFLKEDHNFDLVITEQLFQEAFNTFAYKYNAPLVAVTTFGNCFRHNIVQGNPLQLATVVHEFLNLDNVSSFWGRLKNVYFTTYDYIWWRFVYLKQQEQLVRQYLPDLTDKVPSLYEMQRNISLMLINSHFSYDAPVALLPNIVEIGGIHLFNNATSLPKDLQKILDDSTNGVVYVNFGSNIKSSDLSEDKKNALINVFRRLKQTVIFKWEEDKLENMPENMVIRKWLPQNEILAHRNIKVFISHGGLIGTHEAIYNGVPIIGIPVYGDQYNNLLLLKEAGCGEILMYHDINEQTLETVLLEILNNKTYLEQAKEMSRKFRDRPMTPLDTAIFWIEYVIRNKGADYMKNPARNVTWIVYNMIDVYIFIALLFLSLVTISIIIIKLLFKNNHAKVIKNKKYL